MGLLTIILTIQNIMTKKYWYMYVLSFSGVAEILGYVGRIVTINDPNLTNFIFMDVFLLLTPNLLAYVEYKTVSLLMKKINMSKAWGVLPAKWVSALFVTSDVVSFVVQSCAAGYLTSGNEDLIKTGKIIMLTGLGIQIGFFTLFLVLCLHVFMKSYGLRVVFMAILFQMVCLYTRGVYRIIEFASEKDAFINQHEYFFYIFDTLLIALCFVSYIVFYFPKYLDKEIKPVVYPEQV